MSWVPLEKDTMIDFIRRIEKIELGNAPLWGKMNTAEMFRHVRRMIEISLDEYKIVDKSNVISRLILRPLVFGFLPWSKGMPNGAPEDYHPKPSGNAEFEKEVLVKAMYRFIDELEVKPDIIRISEGFGPVSLTYWSKMHGKHIDHHLKQFGV